MVDRIDSLESELYNEDGEDDYVDYDDDCSGQDEQSVISSGKRKADDDKPLSRLSSMSKRFKIKEVCSDDVDQTLAEHVTDLLHNSMDEEQYNELTKDDVNGRPEHCTGLTVVRTNQLVWDLIAPSTQQIDKKLQYIEKSVITSAIIMTRTVNDMAKDESCGNSQWIDNYNDSLALLGHCNRQINLLRRDLIKPDLCWDYVPLCAHSFPYINFLFGDDVSKSAKEIETCNKLGSRIIRRRQGGRRGFGFRRYPRGGRGGRSRGTGTGNTSYDRHQKDVDRTPGGPKNPRGGGGHEELNEQVKGEFQAGRLKSFISEWGKITSDLQILDIVEHCHIEFVGDICPQQRFSLGRTHFNLKETEIIDNEIYTNLLPKGISKQIEYDKDKITVH